MANYLTVVLFKWHTQPKQDQFANLTLSGPMSTFVRAYLRASTDEQDAQRARGTLDTFAHERGVVICGYYAENESGARLDRPELFRLLPISHKDDVDLQNQLNELIEEVHHEAYLRNCVVDDVLIKDETTGRYWRDYDGGWES